MAQIRALALLIAVSSLQAHSLTSPAGVDGLVAAVYTPFTPNGSLNLDSNQILSQAAYLNASGVGVSFICGTTGESVDLTPDERMALAEAWVAPAAQYGLKLMVHVGAESVEVARALAEHAEKLGVWGIAAMPPTYIKPAGISSLVQTMKRVAGGAPSLPFYYYHIPAMTGVEFQMADFLEAADSVIPTLRGIKFTHSDLVDLLLCTRFKFKSGDHPNMLYGTDGQLLSALVVGAQGAVGSTYNFNGALENKVVEAFRAGDLAAAADAQADVASFLSRVYGVTKSSSCADCESLDVGKALMNLIGKSHGVDVGSGRLPYLPASVAQSEAVKDAARAWCSEAKVGAPWCADLN